MFNGISIDDVPKYELTNCLCNIILTAVFNVFFKISYQLVVTCIGKPFFGQRKTNQQLQSLDLNHAHWASTLQK